MEEQARPTRRSRVVRWWYFGLGWLFFSLGAIGVVLPGLPTTVFMILALWCFSQSSRRFRDWLYYHRVFGPRLQDWQRYRVIPLRVKCFAWAMMIASATYMIWRGDVPWPVIAVTVAVMLFGVVFIARCPSRRPDA